MPQFAVVCVLFRLIDDRLATWLEPVAGVWSLPRAVVADDEDHDHCLKRVVGGLPFARDVVRRAQCGVRSQPGRRTGEREIALVGWATVRAAHPSTVRLAELTGDGRGAWHPLDALPALIDDHRATVDAAYASLGREILGDPVTRRVLPRHLLRSRSDALVDRSEPAAWQPALFGLLPDPFPLSAIRRFYERLLEASIDRGNFRRKLSEIRPTGMIKELPIYQRGVRHRAAQLFTFDARAWERWVATSVDGGEADEGADHPSTAEQVGPADLLAKAD